MTFREKMAPIGFINLKKWLPEMDGDDLVFGL